MSVVVHHCDHVLVGDGSSITDGAVIVADSSRGSRGPSDVPDGTILDVGPASEILPRHAGAPIARLDGVVFPGLVNAHTHLELSALRGKVHGGHGFVPWVESLITTRGELSPEDDADALDRAVDDLVSFGVVAVGDVTNTLAAVPKLAQRGIGGAIFHEVFGHDRASTLQRVASLEAEKEARVPSWPSRDFSYAPAPHTLYTTHPDVVRALLQNARALGARTSLHFAEHAAERRAIEHDDGPVVDWLLHRTRSRPTFPKRSLLEYARDLGALSPDVLLVHLVDAQPSELAAVAEAGSPVVLCPRSNLTIEVRLPPLLSILEAGLLPALGTDSLASSPSLDVLAEARSLADRFPTVPARDLVRMATEGGARALNRPELGVLAKGKTPGLVHVGGHVSGDPSAFLLANVKSTRRMLVTRRGVAPAADAASPARTTSEFSA